MNWTPETLRAHLQTNDRAVEWALVALWKRQTAAEQQAGETLLHNNRGFTSADAPRLTKWASGIYNRGWHLSPRQLAWLRTKGSDGAKNTRIGKYVGQLLDISAERRQEKVFADLKEAA